MPLYDFMCKKCETVTEEILSFKDLSSKKKRPRCPQCNKPMDWLPTGLKAKHGSWAMWRMDQSWDKKG